MWPFQSTLPRGERPPFRSHPAPLPVSIHAPARGATVRRLNPLAISCFNPRSRAGSDHQYDIRFRGVGSFNPRSRAGSDVISIRLKAGLISFNPRSRAGSDRYVPHYDLVLGFQSTLPRGERLRTTSPLDTPRGVSIHAPARGATTSKAITGLASGFNPRSRAGSDRCCFLNVRARLVSIHAPARGAT